MTAHEAGRIPHFNNSIEGYFGNSTAPNARIYDYSNGRTGVQLSTPVPPASYEFVNAADQIELQEMHGGGS
jgi:hypothetical protein